MGIRVKSINNELTRYLAYLFIASIVLNTLTFIIPKDYTQYVNLLVNIIPLIMTMVYLTNLWEVFTMNRLYVHIVPVSKRRIFLDIFIKWIGFYTLVHLTTLGFIAAKMDLNYFFQNVYLKGFLIDLFIRYMTPISIGLFFSVLILISKIFKIKFSIIFIAAIGILSIMPQAKDMNYTYENHIEMSSLDNNGTLITKKAYLSRGFAEEESKIKTEPWMVEETVQYSGLIMTIPVLAILGYCIINIEKASLEDVPRYRKKRALYEKRWYDKWIK